MTLSDLLEGSGLEATVESTPSIKDLDSLADTKGIAIPLWCLIGFVHFRH